MRNALQAIEWPDDALSVYATLKGPFLTFTDGQLLAFKHRHGSLHPLAPLPQVAGERAGEESDGAKSAAPSADDLEVAEALSVLAELHRRRNWRPIADTIWHFLAAVRAHAGLANWRAGEQVLANCLRVVDRARAFEAAGGTSFRGFVELLEDEASRGEGDEAPIVEEGTEGVRIMTVHRAKGLEFPVVILADPTCSSAISHPSRYIDAEAKLWAEPLCRAAPLDVLEHAASEAAHDLAEAVRLAYVAATRARDLLVIPAVGEGEELTGWTEFLNPAVYPQLGARRSPVLEGESVPGCPEFGERTIAEGQARPHPPPESPDEILVKPGLHLSRAGTPIVWWDPAVLQLDVPPATGLREHEILAADEAEVVSLAGVRAHEEWREARRRAREAGARPEARVVTVRAMAAQRATSAEGTAPGDAAPAADEPLRAPLETGHGSGGPLPRAGDATGPAEPLPPSAQNSGPGAVEVRRVARRDGARPGGVRFGELVHRVLAGINLAAVSGEVRELTELQARILGATPEENRAAAETVEDALRDPLLARAAALDGEVTVHREVPVFVLEEGGEIVEGVVDLAFREGRPADSEAPRWTVVDFKTDREEDVLAAYTSQVAEYVRAVERATGEGARGVLLVI